MAIFDKKWKVHLGFWLALAVLGVLIFSIFYPLKIVLMHAFANIALVAGLFYATIFLVDKFWENGRRTTAVAGGMAIFAVVSGLRTAVNLYLLRQFPAAQQAADPVFSPVLRVGTLVLTTSGFVMLFAVSYQLLTLRNRKMQQTQALLQEQLAAQLDFLKAQINPHFLFNALNNIYSLTVLRSPDAPRMLLKLSELLRYVIYEGRKKTVALDRETQQIRTFIELFQMRSEQPADIQFSAAGNLAGRQIEPMILMPIVENCFKHCDFDANPQAFARIELRAEDGGDWLIFQTKNSFDPSDRQKDDTGGVGLENIRRRLELRYGEGFSFDFLARDRVFEVFLKIKTE